MSEFTLVLYLLFFQTQRRKGAKYFLDSYFLFSFTCLRFWSVPMNGRKMGVTRDLQGNYKGVRTSPLFAILQENRDMIWLYEKNRLSLYAVSKLSPIYIMLCL